MPLFETITFAIGPIIAKAFIKILLDNPDYKFIAELAPDLLELGKGRAERLYKQRDDERSLAAIGAQIAARMCPLFDEARLPDDERAALARELSLTLERAQVDAALLLDCNLDPKLVAGRLAAARPEAFQALPSGVETLYHRMLAEAASALIILADSLNGYAIGRDRSNFASQRVMLDQLAEVLSRPNEAAARFKEEYCRVMRTRMERLDLFGVPSVDEVTARQRLSVAYVTLQADRRAASEPERYGAEALLDSLLMLHKGEQQRYGLIDQILAGARRLVIRGEPGAGKTTLLQWLATRAANGDFAPPLTAWNNATPFFVRLRDPEADLNAPECFPALVARTVTGAMPDGWVHEQLRLGHALVLLDGVDEVPSERRPALLQALDQMVESYPLARYIVSSRPAAVSRRNWPQWHEWAKRMGFVEATIQPMTRGDIERFVDYWHNAYAEGCREEDDRNDIPLLPPRLKRLLVERTPLRRLASNPLLCAMICALHLKHRHQLPAERVLLYEKAVEMLIEDRDKWREVSYGNEYALLTTRQKLALIRDFAYRMMRNGESDLSFAEADGAFDSRLDDFDLQPGTTGEQIRRLFVERAHLLREPVGGRLDFAHRTFQEFLAAQAIARGREMDFLLQKIDDDQWRETIVLAAGLFEPGEVTQLLRSLLVGGAKPAKKERREETAMRRAKGQALALACLETCVELPRAVRQEVLSQAEALFPPQSDEVARGIAAAGDLAVPYLQANPRHSEQEAARCIDALAYIGSETALAMIEMYATDTRSQVSEAIGRAWGRFERQEYVRRVLARATHLSLSNAHTSDLIALQRLTKLSKLSIVNSQISDLAPLQQLTNLVELSIVHAPVSDLAPLRKLTALAYLNIERTQASDLAPLRGLCALVELRLGGTPVSDLRPLQGHPVLSRLGIERTRVNDLTPLRTLASLTELKMGLALAADLSPLMGCTRLKYLSVTGSRIRDWGELHDHQGLQIVDVSLGSLLKTIVAGPRYVHAE